MNLVIVESPAKAKTIEKYLGKDYKVLASFGHVVDLPSKDGSVRPDEDFAMDYEISDKSKKHVKALVDAAKKCDAIYLATDPDREGEAISWHVVEVLLKKKAIKKTTPVYRVVFHEITKKAVTSAVANPRTLDMDLVNAQQARRALDYLVGFTLSPVLWRKLPGSRSAGRVQSVALRIICDRENEIEEFKSREYWDIKLGLKTSASEDFIARITHIDGNKLDQFDIVTEKAAGDIVKKLETKQYSVDTLEKKQARRNPQPPFTTSSLQQEASRKLGFGAKRTMSVAQKLYEGINLGGETVGLITYMRTDGVTVSQDAIYATRELIGKNYGDKYVPAKQRHYATKAKNAQEAHEAIRPTDSKRTPEQVSKFLDDDQKKLYDLIWKRMVASQMESAVLNQVVIDIKSQDGYAVARANGSTIAFDGFYKVYREGRDDDKDEEGRILPSMEVGEKLGLNEVTPEQHFTQPPPRYTEASLVKKLEELGIGRPSTYASIISVLQDRNYVRIDKKRFFAEDRGRIVTAFLKSFFSRYVEYDFTAKLENELDHISAGELEWKAMLRAFWTDFNSNIESVKEYKLSDVIHELNILLGSWLFSKDEKGEIDRGCPKCDGGHLSLKLGKFGAFLGCSNYPDCNYTHQLGGSEEEKAGGASDVFEPKMLGVDKESGLDILVKKGPYGLYLQLGEPEDKKEKPKRVSIPKMYAPDDITLDIAEGLLSLPRQVGKHPDTGKVIAAGIGMYGPYVRHDGKYTSLKEDDPVTIGINRAVTLIAENQKGVKKTEPLRVIGKHPENGKDIEIFDGKYGPYVKNEKINASLTKDMTVEDVTIEQAVELLAKQKDRKKSKRGKK
ncbi:MAG: DNA topoisomerase I [Alphaproteobacteria bacterium CG11_big_fil_rev_8_21_14_0_20_39_49]|nr:MAG: DNA topoisomerase I [Alphaproteobacteria bacterium CG11_big_fil_rev_8_21_14_0_20_39_49]